MNYFLFKTTHTDRPTIYLKAIWSTLYMCVRMCVHIYLFLICYMCACLRQFNLNYQLTVLTDWRLIHKEMHYVYPLHSDGNSRQSLDMSYVTKSPWCVYGIHRSANLRKIYTKQYVFHKHLFCNIGNVVNVFAICPHILFYSIARTWSWTELKQ